MVQGQALQIARLKNVLRKDSSFNKSSGFGAVRRELPAQCRLHSGLENLRAVGTRCEKNNCFQHFQHFQQDLGCVCLGFLKHTHVENAENAENAERPLEL